MAGTTGTAIEVIGLVKTFGTLRAVDGLDFSVGKGQVHGFLGPNGAGKSTTIRVLLGLYRASSGRVNVLGKNPWSAAAEVTRQISYVPGDVSLWPNLTGQEVLDALAGLRGAYDIATERALVDAFALDPRRKVGTYSTGNRQKVLLVAAFAARTNLMILDEPTSGLDPLMQGVFQQAVRAAAAHGRTVLLSSHLLDEVDKLCEAVTIIKDGRLVETGKLAQMRHLAAARVTAAVPNGSVQSVESEIAGARVEGLVGGVAAGGRVDLRVPSEGVARVLGILARADAGQIVCAPATLDDLFLRHYAVAAR